jgi:hypothetical protein
MAGLQAAHDRYEELKGRVKATVELVADVSAASADVHVPDVGKALRVYTSSHSGIDAAQLRLDHPALAEQYATRTHFVAVTWVNR